MCFKFATRRITFAGQNFTRCMSSLLSQTRVKIIKIDEHTCIIHLLENMSLAWARIRQLERHFFFQFHCILDGRVRFKSIKTCLTRLTVSLLDLSSRARGICVHLLSCLPGHVGMLHLFVSPAGPLQSLPSFCGLGLLQ